MWSDLEDGAGSGWWSRCERNFWWRTGQERPGKEPCRPHKRTALCSRLDFISLSCDQVKSIHKCPQGFCLGEEWLHVCWDWSRLLCRARTWSATAAYSCLENPMAGWAWGRLQSMGSLRVGHDWATSLSNFTFMHWRRKWQPTPVFLPGESQGRGSLVGCRLWGCTESDTTEAT